MIAKIAKDIEFSLWMTFVFARHERHTVVTIEHLLLALLNNSSAVDVLRSHDANIDILRENLATFIEKNTPLVRAGHEVDPNPTLAFQRVIQRAIMYIRSTEDGKGEVTGAIVLMTIFSEKDSYARSLLLSLNMTRVDVSNYIHNTATKPPPSSA